MAAKLVLCLSGIWIAANSALADDQAPAVKPLASAHAHNDYLHKRPLLDALEHGFTSVEADIFLVRGELLVAHEEAGLRPDLTLSGLYLDPLRQRVRAHNGWVFDKGRTLTLFIDIKSDAITTYAALNKTLANYADILTTIDDGVLKTKAVTVVVSGNRARDEIAAQKVRYAGIDGRLSDIDSMLPAHLMPVISDNWQNHFKWAGRGPMPAAERDKLLAIAKKVHARGRRLRFWATPENPAVWKELHAAGVDLINTDDLDGLQSFLQLAAEKGN